LSKEEVLEKLRRSFLSYDEEATRKAAAEALAAGVDPLEAVSVLTETIRELGEKFSKMEIFLPDLMLAADAMRAGLTVLKPELMKRKAETRTLGKILIGVVKGDIHDIGKTILVTMLEAEGFEVIDLGKDVPIRKFVEEAQTHNPDIIAASALMTTTRPEQRGLIEYLKHLGFRDKYKVMVGGGAVTSQYAEEIGADGYGENAPEAVEVAKKLISK
jgi:trimethylamine corrinoid protein